MKKPGLIGQMHCLSNFISNDYILISQVKSQKHEKTRLNRADALFVVFTCNDYILISQVKGQAA
jgi:hypothetical protein